MPDTPVNPLSGQSLGSPTVPGPQIGLAANPDPGAAPDIGGGPTSGTPANALSGPVSGPDPALIKHVGKLASVGHIFNTLVGTSNDYSIDPNTGKTIATPVHPKPGQMFRNMLAGALMGGAASGGGDFATGLVRGGAAGVQNQQQQDLLRRKQAEDQYKNQLASNEEKRKQQEFASGQELMKAQIAHANLSVVRENNLIRNEDFDFHTRAAAFGKAQLDPILNAGVKAVYRDVPESEMTDMIKNSPGASTLKWYASGVKSGIGPNGQPTYEETYTAVNPTEKIKLTQGLLDSWKEAGLDKYFPDIFQRGSGTELDPQSFVAISQRAHDLMLDKLEREKTSAQTDEAKARAAQARAAAAKDYAERDNYLEGKNKAGAFNKALKNLNDVGSFDKLSPGDKLVLGESAQKAADNAYNVFKTAKANFDEETASKALKDLEFYNGLVKDSLGGNKPAAAAPAGTAELPPAGTPEGEAARTAQAATQRETQRQQVLQGQSDEDLVKQYTGFKGGTMAMGGVPVANIPDPQADDIRQTLNANKNWTTKQKADYIRRVKGAGSDTVSVQIPGQPPGRIPRDKLDAFKKANPNATVTE